MAWQPLRRKTTADWFALWKNGVQIIKTASAWKWLLFDDELG